MIDHTVEIGGVDVSEEVISIQVTDQIETDSDPGKLTVTLANRLKRGYATTWPPQTTPMKITIRNWVYHNESHRAAARGRTEAEYLVAYGHVTDIKRNHEEVVVTGECDLGHLADAISQNYDSSVTHPDHAPRAREVLTDVLDLHKGEKIQLNYFARNPVLEGGKKYNSDDTFQDVLEDLRNDTGAFYYFSEDGVLQFRDPVANRGEYDLDPYITNPDDTSSIMGLRNRVTVIGAGSHSMQSPGVLTPRSETIQATAQDDESIAELGILEAPVDRATHCKTVDQCQARADMLLNFYKMFKDALTKPKVAGIIPPLHSTVTYTVFVPISEDDSVGGEIRGAVVARSISYSIDGLEAELTVAPGVENMEVNVGEADIESYTGDFGTEEY